MPTLGLPIPNFDQRESINREKGRDMETPTTVQEQVEQIDEGAEEHRRRDPLGGAEQQRREEQSSRANAMSVGDDRFGFAGSCWEPCSGMHRWPAGIVGNATTLGVIGD